MNFEAEIQSVLENLKENYGAVGLKAEFETEGANVEEIVLLKNFARNFNLELSIKTGGCGALNDINNAKNISANSIIAPMIETPYALQKYIATLNNAYDFNSKNLPKFYINIETITGFKNLDSIILSDNFKYLNGIILGRDDLIASMNINLKDINSEKILNITQIIAEKMQNLKKEFIIGGGIYKNSIPFLKQVQYLTGFETRKIVFNAPKYLSTNDYKGIITALEFEILWLEHKKILYGELSPRDKKRISLLKEQINNLSTISL